MGLLAEALNPELRAEWGPADDRWYMPTLGLTSDAGVAVTAETVFLCDVVKAAVQFKADAVAVCPPSTYRRIGDDREPVPDHYSQRTLRDPNLRQTSFEWTHLNVTWLSIFGNSYNRVFAGSTSFVDRLEPIHPTRVRTVKKRADGGLTYEILREGAGAEYEWVQQEQILHYRGISVDGHFGMNTWQLIQNAVGISLAAEKHMATFLRKGARVAGLLVTASPLTLEQRKDLSASVNADFGGASNTGTLGILPHGVDVKLLGLDHQKAQFLELQNHMVEKILRGLGVPGVVVGYQGDKASTYASADAFFEKGGLKHCILPLMRNMEERDNKVLLLGQPDLFIKRNLGVLERANTKDSFTMLVAAAGGPIISRNHARRILDINSDPDPAMNRVLQPVNMSPGPLPADTEPEPPAEPTMAPPQPQPGSAPEDGDARVVPGAPLAAERLRRQMEKDAARVVRREKVALADKAPKFARNAAGWRKYVADYYESHVAYVVESLDGIGEEAARGYCTGQAEAVLAGGLAATDRWEAEVAPRLAALALETRHV